ncbi:MAG: helix-turn-helix domain-containing protein [Flavobacteriales bacterium]
MQMSHLEIADSLGTTRVVVSRILKTLEKEGLLSLKRGAGILT